MRCIVGHAFECVGEAVFYQLRIKFTTGSKLHSNKIMNHYVSRIVKLKLGGSGTVFNRIGGNGDNLHPLSIKVTS